MNAIEAMDAEAPAQDWAALLRDEGYCIIPGVIAAECVEALSRDLDEHFARTPNARGAFYGPWTKRFHSLLRRSAHVEGFVCHPLILSVVEDILGPSCESIQLNLTQAIEIAPGGRIQPPHRDQDMWSLHQPGVEYLVNIMWPFTPYTAENGATLIWPGSNRKQDEIVLDPSEAVAAEMKPGDALLFLGSTLHAGGVNRTSIARRGMIISYSLGWLKPYELPWLAYPPEVARGFSPRVAALAGYRAHRPNLGTFEGRCPSHLLDPGGGATLGAIDALRPEQAALIDQFYAGTLPFGPPSGAG